ncbi:hypothetical protein CLV84_0336 [Neolewinella xylanilytica]|uniref:Carboxypeptidase-like protein n=1 Tax=Neolewinella xylanilytica TaxID=1514080 RepID=A0A2S6I7A1_9BACT|nr:hypothetical protein [Neolewinella xylanilytica]PPK87396.1 hypothetical protein CLV84_0336 [Neolewinella xylanilytica]
MGRSLLQLAVFVVLGGGVSAQTGHPPLADRVVSITFSRTNLSEALHALSELADFSFSVNAELLAGSPVISGRFREVTVLDVLQHILPPEIELRHSGNSVILLRAPEAHREPQAPMEYEIQGEVRDAVTGLPLNGATVVEVSRGKSTLSDREGNFSLRVVARSAQLGLSFSKVGYRDTALLLPFDAHPPRVLLLPIPPDAPPPVTALAPDSLPRTVETVGVGRLLLSRELVISARNIAGYTTRKYQLSFTPRLSTNFKIAGSVKNDYSVNLLGGYGYGVGKMELGGVFNIDRKDISGLQGSGVFNLVGGDVNGVQLAGVANVVRNGVRGVQVAGGLNLVRGDQAGWQVSGGGNYADTVSGSQIGVVNVSKVQRGLQIGLVNVNDSVAGTSIGLVSIVRRKGHYTIEAAATEFLPLNLTLRAGTTRLYNIYGVGYATGRDESYLSLGLGLGRVTPERRSWRLRNELTLNWIQGTGEERKQDQGLARYDLLLQRGLTGNLHLLGGPSANFLVSWGAEGVALAHTAPYTLASGRFGNRPWEAWIGFKVGISLAFR